MPSDVTSAALARLAPGQRRRRGERRPRLALRLEDAPLEILQQRGAARDRRLGGLAPGRREHVPLSHASEPRADLLQVGLDLLRLAGRQVAAEDLELDLALELRLALLDDLGVLLAAQ